MNDKKIPKETKVENSFVYAKKDFVIHQNEIHIEIKAGDEISEKLVPKRFWENLKTEGVL